MISSSIQATIFYSHAQDEVAELAQAITPMFEHIRAVCSENERERMRAILQCNYFRRRDVRTVRNMLLRAAKYARNHLGEYLWQEAIIAQTEVLEDAVDRYCKRFEALASEVTPIN